MIQNSADDMYNPERSLSERDVCFRYAQSKLDSFLDATYDDLVRSIPLVDLFRRNIIESAEDYFLGEGAESLQRHGEIRADLASRCRLLGRKLLSDALVRLFPAYDNGLAARSDDPSRTKFSGWQCHTLVLDFDRTYSASLCDVVDKLAEANWPLMRVRYPYDTCDPIEPSPLEKSVPRHFWISDLIPAVQDEVLSISDAFERDVYQWLKTRVEEMPYVSLVGSILDRIIVSRSHVRAAALDALAQKALAYVRPELVITADDSWPQGRSVLRHAGCLTVKFQDGLLVRHKGVLHSMCNKWCVWGELEQKELLSSGIDQVNVLICRSRSLSSPSRSRNLNRPNSRRIVYATRPESRDLSLCEKEIILKALINVARAHPEVSIVNKLHPSEETPHINALQESTPGNFHFVPGNVSFDKIIADASLLIAGVSLTLYQAIAAGVPAAIVTFGPRPNIGIFPPDVFPLITTPRELEEICLQDVRRLTGKQRTFLEDIRNQGNSCPADILSSLLAGSSV